MRSLDALGKQGEDSLLEAEPGQESMKLQRDKRSTAQNRVCRVSGEAIGSQRGDEHGLESLQGSLNVNSKTYWFF